MKQERSHWPLLAVGLAFCAQPPLAGRWPVAGAAVLGAMCWTVFRSEVRWPAAGPVDRRILVGGGIAVCAVAFVFRVWHLGSLPPVWWDEGVESYDAQCLAYGLPLEPLTGIHYHRSPLWSRVISLSGRWSDFSFGSLRFPSAVAGSVAVGLTFAAVLRMSGVLPAVVAGVWLVCHPWELHLSRIMMGNISVPLAGAGIVLVAASAGVSPILRAVVCGLIAGIAVWGYAAALALPGLAVLAVWLLAPARTPVRRRVRDVLICGAVAGVVALPSLVLVPGMWEKTRQVAVTSSPVLNRNLIQTLRMFHIEGDTDLRHNYPPGSPVFHGWLAPLFSLGVALALVSPRSPGALLALGWVYLGLLPGLVSSGGAANQFRMALVPPVAGWLFGMGGLLLMAALGRRLGWVLALLLVGAGAGSDLHAYFVRLPADPAAVVWFRTWALDAGRQLAALAASGSVTVSPPLNLVVHPLEKAVLFNAIRAGRIRFSTRAPAAGARTEFRDPYGEPRSVIIAGRTQVRYLTVADVSAFADLQVHSGRARDAIPIVLDGLRWLPGSALLRERLGFARLAAGELPGAEREFRAALRLRPRLGASWDGLAGALYRQGKLREAEIAVLEAIRQSPEEPEFTADLLRIRSALAARMKP